MAADEGEPKSFQDNLEDATQALEAVRYQEPYDRRLLLDRHAAILGLAGSGLEVGGLDQLTAIGLKLKATRQAAEVAKFRDDESTATDMERTAGDYKTLLDMLQQPKPDAAKQAKSRTPAKTSKAKSGGKGLK